MRVYGLESRVQAPLIQISEQHDMPDPTFLSPVDSTDDLLLFNDPLYQEILNDLRDSEYQIFDGQYSYRQNNEN